MLTACHKKLPRLSQAILCCTNFQQLVGCPGVESVPINATLARGMGVTHGLTDVSSGLYKVIADSVLLPVLSL